MKTSTKALFGGALMAAGLTANAQTFTYFAGDTSGAYQAFAYSQANGGALDLTYDVGNFNTTSTGYSAYFGTTTVSTSQTATSFGASGSWAGDGILGYGYGASLNQVFFTVTSDTQLLVEWNFADTDLFVSGFILTDPGFGVVFDVFDTGLLSGTALVDVFAGTRYGANAAMAAGFGPYFFSTEEQFINISIVPAPGAAALLGAAGLVATRRRR